MVRSNVAVGGEYEPKYPANSYYELKPGDAYRPLAVERIHGEPVPYFGLSQFGAPGTICVCPALVSQELLDSATARTVSRDHNLFLEEERFEKGE